MYICAPNFLGSVPVLFPLDRIHRGRNSRTFHHWLIELLCFLMLAFVLGLFYVSGGLIELSVKETFLGFDMRKFLNMVVDG